MTRGVTNFGIAVGLSVGIPNCARAVLIPKPEAITALPPATDLIKLLLVIMGETSRCNKNELQICPP